MIKMLLVLQLAVAANIVVPSTDLDTLPVVYMGGVAAERPKESIEMLAKMRYIVINKGRAIPNAWRTSQRVCRASRRVTVSTLNWRR
jgi:hypothetical protein